MKKLIGLVLVMAMLLSAFAVASAEENAADSGHYQQRDLCKLAVRAAQARGARVTARLR